MALAIAKKQSRTIPIAGHRTDVLRPLLAVTLAAAGAEVVLLRLISRVGVHIPAMSWARDSYTAAVNLGTYAFPMATVFAAALLGVLAFAVARRRLLPAAIILTLLAFEGWLLLTADRPTTAALHELVLAAALLAVAAAAWYEGRARGVLVFAGLIVVSEVAGQVQHATAILTAGGGRALPLGIASAGEVLLLAALIALPLLLAPAAWRRSAVVGGVVAMLLVGGALAGNGSTTRILAIWTFGLSMPAPVVLYALAAGTLTATAIALWQAGRTAEAAGLILLALGGYVPPSSYQANLLLAGIVLIALPWVLGGARREALSAGK